MRMSVSLVWFNGMGGHPAISYAGEFLLLGRSDHYGSAFEKMEFYPHIPSSERSVHLETLRTRFDERSRDLPKVWIKRKLRRVEFAYMSELGSKEEFIGERPSVFTARQFSLACQELVSVLELLASRIKPSDDIQLGELQTHFHERLQQMPSTDGELQAALQQLRLEEDRRRLA